MAYPLPIGYQCEGSGLERVLRSLPVLVCEFMIFLDLVGTTGSHPSFTFIGNVPRPPGIVGGRGVLEMCYPECTPPVS